MTEHTTTERAAARPAAGPVTARPAAAPGPPQLPPGLLARLPTPCLLVDLAAADRNIAAAARLLRGTGVRLRPHFKAHKCTELMRRQLRAEGCHGVTCQTPGEALALAAAGFTDILVANEVADRSALDQLGRAAQAARVAVAADCLEHVRLLDQTAAAAGVTLDVLVELDVGAGRCGLPAGSPDLVPLAGAIAGAGALRLAGVQAYAGRVQHIEGPLLRRTLCRQVELQVAAELARLAAAGLSCPVVSGHGTGTLEALAPGTVYTEAQAGSYVLLDAAYGRLVPAFETALYCVTTVISRPEPERAVLDAGLKALAVDDGLPVPVAPGLRVLGLSDEHARLAVAPGAGPAVGDKVLLIPSHVDPTVNLHDALFAYDGQGLQRWPVDGRRVTALPALAASVPAWQDRPDDPQKRNDEAQEAKYPVALAEAQHREDDKQDKVDDS
jgi:3-hydroxy-D-aspartate aldolase